MKVGLVTFHRLDNYGAVLQAYALQQCIARLGAECEVIDLLRPEHPGYRPASRTPSYTAYSPKAGPPAVPWLLKAKGDTKKILNWALGSSRRRRFEEFDKSCMRYFPSTFASYDDLYRSVPSHDGFVVGSDQVWNPTYPCSPEPYFLTFAPSDRPRIAYAPSFGVARIDPAHHSQYRLWLQGMHSLSIRERQGAEIIRELTGRKAEVVVDPTLLLDVAHWRTMARAPHVRRPYVFCYSLRKDPQLLALCRHVRKISGYPVYMLGDVADQFRSCVRPVLTAGPMEFLGWIMNAAVVLTNSFHGMMFSLAMSRPFYVALPPAHGTESRNSRLLNAAEVFGVGDRIWDASLPMPAGNGLAMDHHAISARVEAERARSRAYLQSALVV